MCRKLKVCLHFGKRNKTSHKFELSIQDRDLLSSAARNKLKGFQRDTCVLKPPQLQLISCCDLALTVIMSAFKTLALLEHASWLLKLHLIV